MARSSKGGQDRRALYARIEHRADAAPRARCRQRKGRPAASSARLLRQQNVRDSSDRKNGGNTNTSPPIAASCSSLSGILYRLHLGYREMKPLEIGSAPNLVPEPRAARRS